MKNARIKRAATLGLMAGILSVPLAALASEEMTVETPKVYTPGKVNGVEGFWVEYKKEIYRKGGPAAGIDNDRIIVNERDRVGLFDQTFQDLYSQYFPHKRLSKAELTALYNQHKIPTGFTEGKWGGNSYDFTHNKTIDGPLKEVGAKLAKAKALANPFLSSDSMDTLKGLGKKGLDQYAKEVLGRGYYTYTERGLNRRHGVSYSDDSVDKATYDALRAKYPKSYKQLFDNASAADLDKIKGHDYVSAILNCSRLEKLADLLQSGAIPDASVDFKVITPNGPVQITEVNPTPARLRQISKTIASTLWVTHSPIALDLNHDGKIGVTGVSTAQRRMAESAFVGTNSVWFDITAAGKKMNIEWLDRSGDGFLVDDSHGRISKALTKGGELDGTFLYGDTIGYAHGYHKLAVKKVHVNIASTAQLDERTNWSKLFDEKPVLKGDVLNSLKVWVDANGDAKLQGGELKTLASLGITELGATPITRMNEKGEYLIQSYFVQNGKRHLTEDVWFAENPATMEKK